MFSARSPPLGSRIPTVCNATRFPCSPLWFADLQPFRMLDGTPPVGRWVTSFKSLAGRREQKRKPQNSSTMVRKLAWLHVIHLVDPVEVETVFEERVLKHADRAGTRGMMVRGCTKTALPAKKPSGTRSAPTFCHSLARKEDLDWHVCRGCITPIIPISSICSICSVSREL